jgi:hypothetical protein
MIMNNNGQAMDPTTPLLDDDNTPSRSNWSMLKRAFIRTIDPLSWRYVRMSTDKSEDLELFPLPSHAVTRRELANAPIHLNNADGKALVWAYIGDDDPTRGDSRGSTGLARQIARQLNGRMLYIDRKMLDENFPNTRRTEQQLEKLIARDGTPDIIMGTFATTATMATTIKPTMVVTRYNEDLRHDPRRLVPHDLTPEILADAGRELRTHYPDAQGKLFGVLMASFNRHNACASMMRLAELCAHEQAATIFFCPSRRTINEAYLYILTELGDYLKKYGAESRTRIIALDFEKMRNGYNPYRGLLDQADHMLLLGDSQSMVSEAITNGRPLYLGRAKESYWRLKTRGYIHAFDDVSTENPMSLQRLAPISITEATASQLTAEFIRLARLRTIGTQEQNNTRPQSYKPRMVA